MKVMNIFVSFISWLLHHANRGYSDPGFYSIKNSLLKKYGKHICYDIQFIQGKKCYSCGGTGIHIYYSDYTGKEYDRDLCWHCHNGWYKRPVWNILARVQFGKYFFHQPYQRSYKKPDNSIPIIEGYIDHKYSKYSDFAATILFLFYQKGYFKKWVVRVIKNKGRRIRNYFNRIRNRIEFYHTYGSNELPF